MSSAALKVERLVTERYQFKPFIGSSHAWALNQLENLNKNARVLDIGPGTGDIVRQLKNQGLNKFFAIEVDVENIKRLQAENLYQQITSELADLSENKFDCVLLLDVLEHMVDPFAFLRGLHDYLNPGAIILISVPNIAHWSIRLRLLFGVFDYQERGILDKTHLQFFTQRRFQALIDQLHDCSTVELQASIEPLEFVLPKWLTDNAPYQMLRKLQLNVAQVLPGFFAYQHLGLLRKN